MTYEEEVHNADWFDLALKIRDEFYDLGTDPRDITLSTLVGAIDDWRYWELRGEDGKNAAIVQRTYQGGMSTASGDTPKQALARAMLIEQHRETNGS